MCFGAVASIAGGLLGASAAGDAADAQAAAAANQLALEKQMYDETVERFQPFLNSGVNAQNALAFELGLAERPTFGGNPMDVVEFTETSGGNNGQFTPRYQPGSEGAQNPAWNATTTTTRYRVGDQVFSDRAAAEEYAAANPTGGTEYQGFQATPSYEFRMNSGLDALNSSAAARGSLNSGATLKALEDYRNNLSASEYDSYISRLGSMASSGQAAAGNAANASANYASGAGQAYGNMGNAQAAGYIGQANAWNTGIGNAIGTWNYQNQLNGGSSGGIFNGLFSGAAPGSANSLAL